MKRTLLNLILVICLMPIITFAQWPNDPSINLEVVTMDNSAAVPHIAHDDFGNYFAGFYSIESENYNIRVQKLDAEGNYLWGEDGLLISEHEQNTWVSEWDLQVDHEGNCIIAFSDIRTGSVDIHAYKISPDGDFLWGNDGINIGTESEEYAPVICTLDDNSVIIAWEKPETTTALQMHRINPDGTLEWGEDGITYASGSDQSYTGPRIVPSGDDFVVAFYKQTGPGYSPTRHIYVQKFDINGEPVWSEDILASNENGISGWTDLNVITDNNGGIIIGWHDDRDNNMTMDAAIQYVQSDGTMIYPEGGIELTTTANNNYNYVQPAGIAEDGSIFAAFDFSDGNQNFRGVKAQKVSSTGDLEWGTDGYSIVDNTGDNANIIGAKAYENTLYVSYEIYDQASPVNTSVYAHAITQDGSPKWDADALVSSRPTERTHSMMSAIKNDQMIVAWEDGLDNEKIYAQNFTFDGNIGNGGTVLNDDASLFMILVDDISLPGFDSEIFEYDVIRPDITPIPEVSAICNDPAAQAEITQTDAVPGTATILVTAEDGITQQTYLINFSSDIAVNNINPDINVYPIPSNDQVYIDTKNQIERIEIYNHFGQRVKMQNSQTKTINLENLNSGQYIIKIISTNGITITKKIIKQ